MKTSFVILIGLLAATQAVLYLYFGNPKDLIWSNCLLTLATVAAIMVDENDDFTPRI